MATLVTACTSDVNIENYKERWHKLISTIKRAGQDAVLIKLVDQMDNLSYYLLVSSAEKKKEVMWKHKFFIKECAHELKQLPLSSSSMN